MRPGGRLEQWLSLTGIVLGCSAAFLIWGQLPDAEARLRQRSLEFSSLSPAEQNSVLESYFTQFQKCSPERQQTLRRIMEAVSEQPDLNVKLHTLNEWFLSLPRAEQSLWREKIASGDARAVSGRIHEFQQVSRLILVDFSPGRFSRQRTPATSRPETNDTKEGLPVLALTYRQYAAILDEAFPDDVMSPREYDFMGQLVSAEERILCKTLQLLTRMREDRFGSEYADALVTALSTQTESYDSEWRNRFTESIRRIDRVESGSFRRIAKTMTVIAVLDEAVVALGARFKDGMQTPQHDLIEAFADLEDTRKRSQLMISTPETARDELRKVVIKQQQVDDPARRQLMLKLIDYEENLSAFRDTIFGRLGGFSGRSSGGPPPPSSLKRHD